MRTACHHPLGNKPSEPSGSLERGAGTPRVEYTPTEAANGSHYVPVPSNVLLGSIVFSVLMMAVIVVFAALDKWPVTALPSLLNVISSLIGAVIFKYVREYRKSLEQIRGSER
jgi:predicted membrane protein